MFRISQLLVLKIFQNRKVFGLRDTASKGLSNFEGTVFPFCNQNQLQTSGSELATIRIIGSFCASIVEGVFCFKQVHPLCCAPGFLIKASVSNYSYNFVLGLTYIYVPTGIQHRDKNLIVNTFVYLMTSAGMISQKYYF